MLNSNVMMESLRGKTLLIGKAMQEHGYLCLAIFDDNNFTTTVVKDFGRLPDSVSRCKPEEKIAHCKIEFDLSGNMILSNMKSQNVTYVNGIEIVSKKIKEDCVVELGIDKYRIDLKQIIKITSILVDKIGIKKVVDSSLLEYSVGPLKEVWNDYHKKTLEIKYRNKKLALLRSASPMFTLGSGAVATLAKTMGWGQSVFVLTTIMTVFGLILMMYGFYKGYADKSIEESERLLEEFQHNYICPNPKCKHFMGMQPYHVLKQNKKCPFCGCLLTDK